MSAKNEYLRVKWKHIIEEQMKSDMSRKAWCKENDVSYESFKYWLNKFRVEGLESALAELNGNRDKNTSICVPAKSAQDVAFVELSPALINKKPVPDIDQPSAIIKCGKISIEIMPSASPSFIRHIIEVVSYV